MPTPHIGAEAITPVISATGRIQGNSAIPVYVYTSIPSDRRGLGMAAQPVVFINDSDLVENGGQYKLQGRLTALPVIQMPAGSRAIGMPAIPVYDVTNKAWPPAFNPVVPPSGFPPVTTGLLLNLQADALALNDGDPVGTWADASGLHNDFSQTGANRPTYRANVLGFPTVYFDSSVANQFLVGPDFADDLDSFTVFAIAKYDSSIGNGQDLLCKTLGLAGWTVQIGGFEDINPLNSYDDYYLKVVTDPNVNQLVEHLTTVNAPTFLVSTYNMVSRSELHVYRNGDNTGETNSNAGVVTSYHNTEPVRIGLQGGGPWGPTSAITAWVVALMMYSPALSPADRATMEAALKTKYGIP